MTAHNKELQVGVLREVIRSVVELDAFSGVHLSDLLRIHSRPSDTARGGIGGCDADINDAIWAKLVDGLSGVFKGSALQDPAAILVEAPVLQPPRRFPEFIFLFTPDPHLRITTHIPSPTPFQTRSTRVYPAIVSFD